MHKSKSIKGILGISVISIIIMYILENIIQTGYFQKSVVKMVMFLILPILYTLYDKNIKVRDNFKIKSRENLMPSLIFNYLNGKGGNIYNSWIVHIKEDISNVHCDTSIIIGNYGV